MYIILPLFIVGFLLANYQYLAIDPKRRILNARFGLMIGAIIAVIGYPIYAWKVPGDRHTSWVMLGLAIFWVLYSLFLLRRMPPRENY